MKITDQELNDELKSGKTVREIAAARGMDVRNLWRRKKGLAAKGHGHGGDVSKLVPDGYKVKGTSTLTDAAGNTKLQWVKTDVDADRQLEMMQQAVKALCADITPVDPVSGPGCFYKNLLNLYTISDFHLGMMACEEEGGADFDVKIAEELFDKWFSQALRSSPEADIAVISLLGDTLHYDSLKPTTVESGHVLAADTRYFRMIEIVMRMTRRAIDMALRRHNKVHVVVSQGNHDPASSLWLTQALNLLYDNEPRLTVDPSPDVFKMFRHGDTVLFFHHGHRVRFDSIESVMIGKFRRDFGETKYAYCHVGHLHHQKVVESRNMIVEQHRTLAAKDEYASSGGWFSGRSANVITYHKQYGEVSRLTISPEMLR